MGVRAIAVDEDGTFLRDHVHYDIQRFEALWTRMEAAGIRFVVATGNQYQQVRDLFATHADQIGYVCAAGAYVLDGGLPLRVAKAPAHVAPLLSDYCRSHPDVPFCSLGPKGCHVPRQASRDFFDDMATYCHEISWVDDLAAVADEPFLFSSVVDERAVDDVVDDLKHLLKNEMSVVKCGEGYFDVMCPGVTKASGLEVLLAHWAISAEELVAFGDSDNDLEMLSLAGVGYAMENAPAHVRDAADKIAPPCTEDGVLAVLEDILP